MQELVQKKGQKFFFLGEAYTAKSFFGKSGIEYDTALEAIADNAIGTTICVKNEEFDGVTDLKLSFKI